YLFINTLRKQNSVKVVYFVLKNYSRKAFYFLGVFFAFSILIFYLNGMMTKYISSKNRNRQTAFRAFAELSRLPSDFRVNINLKRIVLFIKTLYPNHISVDSHLWSGNSDPSINRVSYS